MALTNKPTECLQVQGDGQTSAPIFHGVEKAGQTYKRGAFLIDDDAGRITESASPIDASAVTKRTLGIATADATGVTGADVLFGQVGEAARYQGTLSDATAGTHTLAQADQWQTFPITKDGTFSTGRWYLNAAAVSDTGGGMVVEFVDPIGTVDGRVIFLVTTPARGGANAGSANL